MLSKDNLNYARRPARRVACWTRFVSPVHLWLIYNFEHCGTLWPVDHVQVVCICSLDYILRVLWSCISCISCILCQFLVFAILQSTEFLDVCDCCRTSSQTRTSLTRLNGAVLESKVGKTAEIELRWNECSHKMSQLQTAFELHCLIYWGSVRARDHSPIFRNQSQKRKSSTWISLMGSQKENCSHQNHPALQYSKPKSCKLSLCHFSCPLTLPLCPSLSLSLSHTLQLFDGNDATMPPKYLFLSPGQFLLAGKDHHDFLLRFSWTTPFPTSKDLYLIFFDDILCIWKRSFWHQLHILFWISVLICQYQLVWSVKWCCWLDIAAIVFHPRKNGRASEDTAPVLSKWQLELQKSWMRRIAAFCEHLLPGLLDLGAYIQTSPQNTNDVHFASMK